MDQRRSIKSALLTGVLLLAATPMAAQTLYRYVDAQGKVHYTDKLTPDTAGRSLDQMNKQGTIIRRTEAAPTAEELVAREADRRRRAEDERLAKIEDRKNQALLITYPLERDIDEARRYSLKYHEDVVRETNERINAHTKRKAELLAQPNAAHKQEVQREVHDSEVEIRALSELLLAKRRDIAVINARFDEDKRRYQEILRARNPTANNSSAELARPASSDLSKRP